MRWSEFTVAIIVFELSLDPPYVTFELSIVQRQKAQLHVLHEPAATQKTPNFQSNILTPIWIQLLRDGS